MTWPNRVSLIRLLLVAPFIVLLMNLRDWGEAARYGALAIFLMMAVSDAVDGLLARRMNLRSRLGAILDPLADKVMIICAAVFLSLPDSSVIGARLPSWVVVAIVAKDLWVILGIVVLHLVTDKVRISPTIAGKLSTVAQAVMVLMVLISPDVNRLAAGVGSMAAGVMGWAVVALCGLAILSYTKRGLSQLAEGEKPLDDEQRRPMRNDESHTGHSG